MRGQRRPWGGLGAILVVLAGCAAPARLHREGSVGEAAEVPVRRFRFTYRVEVPPPTPGTRRLDVWVPLPQEDPGVQEVAELRIRTSVGTYCVTRDPDYGNAMVYVGVDRPHAPVRIVWEAVITRYEDRGQSTLPMRPRYLAALRRVPLTGRARQLAEALGLTDESVPLTERVLRLAADVVQAMEYDKSVPGYGLGDFERAVTVCRGNCTDFHARFMGIARAAGIPVRFTMGIPLTPSPRGRCCSYHCWAHWYDGRRWRPVDLSEADKLEDKDPERARRYFRVLDPHRVALTVGRDLTLAPPQQGDLLNYFVYPYAEADGRPLELPATARQFSWEPAAPSVARTGSTPAACR